MKIPERMMITLTGPSCSGKSTLERAMRDTGRYVPIRSFTTRTPRPNEVHGREYDFITPEEFHRLHDAGEVVQFVHLYDTYYGSTKAQLEEVFASGKTPVIVVEPTGIAQFENAGERFDFEVFPVYVDASTHVLLVRYAERIEKEVKEQGVLSPKTKERLSQLVLSEILTWPSISRTDLRISDVGVINGLTTEEAIEKIEQAIDISEQQLAEYR